MWRWWDWIQAIFLNLFYFECDFMNYFWPHCELVLWHMFYSMQFNDQVFLGFNSFVCKIKTMMEKSVLATWFVIAATISTIPLVLEYSKVTRKYEIIKKPRHRHFNSLSSKHNNHHNTVGSKDWIFLFSQFKGRKIIFSPLKIIFSSPNELSDLL